jgi:hypothetical protein
METTFSILNASLSRNCTAPCLKRLPSSFDRLATRHDFWHRSLKDHLAGHGQEMDGLGFEADASCTGLAAAALEDLFDTSTLLHFSRPLESQDGLLQGRTWLSASVLDCRLLICQILHRVAIGIGDGEAVCRCMTLTTAADTPLGLFHWKSNHALPRPALDPVVSRMTAPMTGFWLQLGPINVLFGNASPAMMSLLTASSARSNLSFCQNQRAVLIMSVHDCWNVYYLDEMICAAAFDTAVVGMVELPGKRSDLFLW